MSTHVDILATLKLLGRDQWNVPEPFGPDGWSITSKEDGSSIIVTCSEQDDGQDWIHASIAHADRDPSYAELKRLHLAVWRGRGYAYQVFVPETEHVNIHDHALHLWGRLDGTGLLPTFGTEGSI